MSDTTPTPTPVPAPTPAPAPAPPVGPPVGQPPDPTPTPPARETDWKAEARKWEERAKANHAAATELAKLKDADKTEIQRALERAQGCARRR